MSIELKSIFDQQSQQVNSIQEYFNVKKPKLDKILAENLTPVQSKYGKDFDDLHEFRNNRDKTELSDVVEYNDKDDETSQDYKPKKKQHKQEKQKDSKQKDNKEKEAKHHNKKKQYTDSNTSYSDTDTSTSKPTDKHKTTKHKQAKKKSSNKSKAFLPESRSNSNQLISLNHIIDLQNENQQEIIKLPETKSPMRELVEMFGYEEPKQNKQTQQDTSSAKDIVYISQGTYDQLVIQPGKTYIGIGNVMFSNIKISEDTNTSGVIIVENINFQTSNKTIDLINLYLEQYPKQPTYNITTIFKYCSFKNTLQDWIGKFNIYNTVKFYSCEFVIIGSKNTTLFDIVNGDVKFTQCYLQFNNTSSDTKLSVENKSSTNTTSEITIFNCRSNRSCNCTLNMNSNTIDLYINNIQELNFYKIDNTNYSITSFNNLVKLIANKNTLFRHVLDTSVNSVVRSISNTFLFQHSNQWSVSPGKIRRLHNRNSNILIKDDYLPAMLAKKYEEGYEHIELHINNTYSNIRHLTLSSINHTYNVKPTDKVIVLDNKLNTVSTVKMILPDTKEMTSYVDVNSSKNTKITIVGSNGKSIDVEGGGVNRIIPGLSNSYIVL